MGTLQALSAGGKKLSGVEHIDSAINFGLVAILYPTNHPQLEPIHQTSQHGGNAIGEIFNLKESIYSLKLNIFIDSNMLILLFKSERLEKTEVEKPSALTCVCKFLLNNS